MLSTVAQYTAAVGHALAGNDAVVAVAPIAVDTHRAQRVLAALTMRMMMP